MSDSEQTRLYSALRRLLKEKEKSDKILSALNEPIAIVGMACRFPGGANSPEAYWDNLCAGLDSASPIPSNRWDHSLYYNPSKPIPGKIYTQNAHFIDDYDYFDADFFAITPKEVDTIDPQQRLLMELTLAAFENGLMTMASYRGSQTGVFIGHFTHDYGSLLTKYVHDEEISAYATLNNSACTAAGRLSYQFGFQGPSMPINTACSSSLVAAHLACQSLRLGECDLAVVGGANLILSPEIMINICQAQMLSTDGRCHTFDKSANGYGRGEGAAIVLLKRLSDAIKERDIIEAVILGSGTNQDGASSALTVPNGVSQEALMSSVLKKFNISTKDIEYIEAHGTGTALGDPIEINAINQVYQGSHQQDNPLYVSTVKTNIGHLEAAAGVAAMIKVACCLKHKMLPPHLHLERLNSAIDLTAVPIMIPKQLTNLSKDKRSIAAINAFGFSGSNAHLIMQEAHDNDVVSRGKLRSHFLTKLSAKNSVALIELINNILNFLDRQKGIAMDDFSYSCNVGRDDYECRITIQASDLLSYCSSLENSKSFIVPSSKKDLIWHFETLSLPHFTREFVSSIPFVEQELVLIFSRIDQVTQIQLSFDDFQTQEPIKLALLKFSMSYAIGSYYKSLGLLPKSVYADENSIYAMLALSEKISIDHAISLAIEESHLKQGIKNSNQELVNSVNIDSGLYPVYVNNIVSVFKNMLLIKDSDAQNPNDICIGNYFLMNDTLKNSLSDLYKKLGECYQYGHNLDWKNFEFGFEQKKIKIPNYPLQKKPYISPILNRMHARNKEIDSEFLYKTVYQPLTRQVTKKENEVTYLCFNADPNIQEDFSTAMSDSGCEIIHVIFAKQFLCLSENLYTIDADSHHDIIRLLKEINKPFVTLYALPLQSRSNDAVNLIQDAIKQDVMFIKHYHQAVTELKLDHTFYYLTRDAHGFDHSTVNLSSASIMGLLKAINFEYATTRYINIDFSAITTISEIVKNLLIEVCDNETQIIYRDGNRFVPRLQKLQKGALYPSNKTLKNDKSYVITGGLGGLGLSLAQELIKNGAGCIHLLSRRVPDSVMQSQFKQWCVNGGRIESHQVDIVREDQLIQCLNYIQENSFPIAGLFHLAGVDERTAFLDYDWETFNRVIQAKIVGALGLHYYSQSLNLDYFVLFSSVASSIGSSRQAPYVTANAFLDGLASLRVQSGLPVQNINWGPWSEVGMVQGGATVVSQVEQHVFSKSEALTLFRQLLSTQLTHITVVKSAFLNFLIRFFKDSVPGYLNDLVPQVTNTNTESTVVSVLKNALPSQYDQIIETYLLDGFRKVTHWDINKKIDLEQSFFDMGLDSLMSIELAEYCSQGFSSLITLPPTLLFDAVNINSLTKHISERVRVVLQPEIQSVKDEKQGFYTEDDIKNMSTDEIDAIIAGGHAKANIDVY